MSKFKISIERLSPKENMEKDLSLFLKCEEDSSLSYLRIYGWVKPAVTVGFLKDIDKILNVQKAKDNGIEIVKRATGGGIVFHQTSDITYSFITAKDDPLLPKGLIPSCNFISQGVVNALKLLGVEASLSGRKLDRKESSADLCFSFPAEYEVLSNGKKISGGAQRRGRKAFLQQGTIFVSKIPKEFAEILEDAKDFQIDKFTTVEEALGRMPTFEELSEALRDGFRGMGVK